ncbi:hypothetical protein DENIS_2214 [Desulfonema ishimotonii]|uniref:Uncharacterized protein n=1 Tax=Desulfonema ishimotonii TaxID=45657 RepID=A0A401FWD9_9BACT|nr:hypothetical protein [Desulfonema ishimotonii]GBC61254.1 hypothetical protein DENIS_2214 [Desulfonema ishimotonii]
MQKRIVLVIIGVLLLNVALAGDLKLKYKRYLNARFGYGISYPEGLLIPQGEADNGDGQKFLSEEHDVEMAVWGGNNALDETLHSRFLEHLQSKTNDHPNRNVTYKHLGRSWFVVSGFNGDKVFYNKTIFINDTFLVLHITYPKAKKTMLDPITSSISKSFKYLSTPKTEPLPTK